MVPVGEGLCLENLPVPKLLTESIKGQEGDSVVLLNPSSAMKFMLFRAPGPGKPPLSVRMALYSPLIRAVFSPRPCMGALLELSNARPAPVVDIPQLLAILPAPRAFQCQSRWHGTCSSADLLQTSRFIIGKAQVCSSERIWFWQFKNIYSRMECPGSP